MNRHALELGVGLTVAVLGGVRGYVRGSLDAKRQPTEMEERELRRKKLLPGARMVPMSADK